MDTQALLQADYLDIIFGHRNKKYGGYELRKHYSQRVTKSLLFLLTGAGMLAGISFVAQHSSPITLMPAHHDPYVLADVHPRILPPPPAAKKIDPPPPSHVKAVAYTVPQITDEPIKPEQQMKEVKELNNAQPGATTTAGDPAGAATGNNTEHGGTGVINHVEVDKTPKIWVAQMPRYIGDLNDFIKEHIRYPDAARESNIEGMVLVRFVVNEDGSVSDAVVLRGIGGGCDEEALRIVNAMPRWVPGKQNGMPVKVYFQLPIKFMLN